MPMTLRHACCLILLMGLSACGNSASRFEDDECPHWAVRVFAPRYMEAWVEALYVKDDRGNWIQIPQGMAGNLGQTDGWGDAGPGGGVRLHGTGAPMEVFVRWQSLAEPQTYRWQFTVPESVRQAMRKKEQVQFWWKQTPELSCRSDISVGVAPGGHTVAWSTGMGFKAKEIVRGKAEVEPLGPWQGKGKEYAYPLSDKAKTYVQEHGIPYDSW